MDARMSKSVEKYKKFFTGKPTEAQIKGLISRFPSLTEDEAKLFLEEQYYVNRSKVYEAANKAKDFLKEHKGIVVAGVMGIALAAFYISQKKKAENN